MHLNYDAHWLQQSKYQQSNAIEAKIGNLAKAWKSTSDSITFIIWT
jgi:hypothetical protein